MKIKANVLAGAALALALSIPAAIADTEPGMVETTEEAQAVFEQRTEFMKGFGKRMKAFSDYLKRGDGEPLELASMAAEIAEKAPEIPSLFPVGTGLEMFEESGAKSKIWEEWGDFVAAANAVPELASALEVAFDSGDPGQVGAKLKALGGNGCGNCHKPFRQKKE